MTNIYINGLSGKMGSSICDLSTNDETISIVNDDIKNADVVIDFSRPDSSLKVLNQCIHYKKPLLIGTTGFNDNQIKTIRLDLSYDHYDGPGGFIPTQQDNLKVYGS